MPFLTPNQQCQSTEGTLCNSVLYLGSILKVAMLVVSNSRPTKHNIQILLALVLADIYRAGTLLSEIIVTLIIQKHISHCYVRQLRISEHTTLSYNRQKNWC